jgi:hypothetical protein
MKQRIAILAPGPSLPKYWKGHYIENYETVIAVNNASASYEAHWAVMIDEPMILKVLANEMQVPRIGFVSINKWRNKLQVKTGKQYRDFPGSLVGCYWSFCNALFFANTLRRESDFQIHVYGFDCALDAPDYTGLGSNHSSERFTRELTWIRAAWRNNTAVFSDLHDEVLSWLKCETNNLELK